MLPRHVPTRHGATGRARAWGGGAACVAAGRGVAGGGCGGQRRHKSVIGGRSVAEVCISVREPRPNRLAARSAIFHRAPPPSRGVRSAGRSGAAAGPGLGGGPSDSEGTRQNWAISGRDRQVCRIPLREPRYTEPRTTDASPQPGGHFPSRTCRRRRRAPTHGYHDIMTCPHSHLCGAFAATHQIPFPVMLSYW